MEFYDLSVKQGETFNQVLIFKDPDGTVMDLTGFTGYCQVRPDPDSDDLTATMTVAITAADGKVVLSLSAATTAAIPTGSYAYDFAMKSSGNDVRYYIGGKFCVLPSVTEIS